MATHQPRTTLPDDGPIGRLFGSARAVRVGNDVFLGAHLPLGDDGEVAPGTVVDHLALVCAGIERTLVELGGTLGDLVALHVFVAGAPTDEEWPPFADLHRRYFGPDKPASTLLYVPELPFGALVQISAVARIADPGA